MQTMKQMELPIVMEQHCSEKNHLTLTLYERENLHSLLKSLT